MIKVDLQSYNNLLLYSTVFCCPVADVVEILVLDKDHPQDDIVLVTAGAKEMVKYHIQGPAVVDKPQNIPAECLVVTITV